MKNLLMKIMLSNRVAKFSIPAAKEICSYINSSTDIINWSSETYDSYPSEYECDLAMLISEYPDVARLIFDTIKRQMDIDSALLIFTVILMHDTHLNPYETIECDNSPTLGPKWIVKTKWNTSGYNINSKSVGEGEYIETKIYDLTDVRINSFYE